MPVFFAIIVDASVSASCKIERVMNDFFYLLTDSPLKGILFNLSVLIISILIFDFILLRIFRRNQSEFNKLFRSHIKTTHSEMLIYNYRRDRFVCVSSGQSFFSGLTLSQFACQFVESEMLVKRFGQMRATYADYQSFICTRIDGKTNVILYVHPIKRFGKVRQIDIILRENDILKNDIKKLSFSDFRSLFDLVSTGFIFCEADGTIIDVNKSAMNIFGIPDKEELLLRRLNIFKDPHYKGPASIDDFTNNSSVYIDQFDFDATSHSVFSRCGKCTLANRYYKLDFEGHSYIVIITNDLTVNAGNDVVVATMYNEQQTILQMSPVGYVIFNVDGKYEYSNRAFYDILEIAHPEDLNLDKVFEISIFPDEFITNIALNDVSEAMVHIDFTDKIRSVLGSTKVGTLDLKVVCHRTKSSNMSMSNYVFCVIDMTEQVLYVKQIETLDHDKEMLMHIGGMTAWTQNLVTGKREQLSGVNIFPELSDTEVFEKKVHPYDAQLIKLITKSFKSGQMKESHNVVRIKKSVDDADYSFYELSMALKQDDDKPVAIGCIMHDVTSQTLNQQLLEQSRVRTQLTVQDADLAQFDVFVATDSISVYQKNPFFYDSNQQSLSKIFEYTHPDDQQIVLEVITKIRAKKDFTQTFYYRAKKGADGTELRHLQVFLTPLKHDAFGKVEVYTGIARDNTKWNKLLKEQEDNNYLLNTFINSVPCLFAMKDVGNGLRYVNVNDVACELAGLTREDFIGRNDMEIFSHIPGFNPGRELESDLFAVEKGLYEYDVETQINGQKRYWHTTKRVITITSGQCYLLMVSLEITQMHENFGKLNSTVKTLEETNKKLKDSMSELDESNYLINTFVNSVPCMFCMKDADNDFRFVMVNDMACDLTGMRREDVIGRTSEEAFGDIVGFYQQSENESDIETMKNGFFEGDFVTTFDGQKRIWHTTKRAVETTSGHKYVLMVSLEVTQLHVNIERLNQAVDNLEQMNKKLTVSMAELDDTNFLLDMFINSVPCLFWMKDVDDELRYVLVNESACKPTGLSASDFIGHTDAELFHDKDRFDLERELRTDLEAIEKGSISYMGELPIPDGRLFFHTTKNIIKTKSGRRYLIVMLSDVTELQETIEKHKKAIKESERLNTMLYTFINSIPCQFFMKDIGDGFRYSLANDKFCEMLGLSREYVIGKCESDLLPVEIAQRIKGYDKLAVEYGNYDYDDFFSLSGQKKMWRTQKKILELAGKKYMIATSLDITKQFETLEELKLAKAKAEESDKLKSAFLANMSHEIRTPLNAIVGFSELLTTTDDPTRRASFSKYITTNSDLLLGLINDILDVSRFEAGYVKFDFEKFDVSELCRITCESFKSKLKQSITLSYINAGDSCIVEYDKKRLTQVINNFLTNANKYTSEGFIRLGYTVENDGVKVFVEDSGIGIPEDKKSRVFGRFEKLDSFAQGTGLGLSICKLIAEASGGEVGFDSEEGKGSTFWAWIPMKTFVDNELPNVQVADVNEIDKMSNVAILVAEDNDSNFMLIEEMLRDMKVERAKNGFEAVEMVRKNKYSIVFMDLKMPEMGGLDATRNIRKFDSETPIVALTANSFESDKKEAFDAGCNMFLSKPVRLNDLYNVVSALLGGGKFQ